MLEGIELLRFSLDFFLFVALELLEISPGYNFTVFTLLVKTIEEVILCLIDNLSISSRAGTMPSFDPLVVRIFVDYFD